MVETMLNIQVLDQITIDKIAAGEVIERPASIVKELVENSIDAGATSVTVEIKEGGITFIRITDNGCGIPKEEIPLAFLRHSTSKIRDVRDLEHIASLGFRGEALSSIAAISQVELITKPKDAVAGVRYCIEGGVEKGMEEIGAPDGTTFLIHQIFYNTPARRKFLKTPMTEASHISDLMIRLALSHPEVSIQFINNGTSKIRTSGNGKLKDVIYQVYGREVANNLIEIEEESLGLKVSGFLGKPLISRGNRNYENYYINGRYVKSNIISKAIEDGYSDYSMQHKYPFTVLHFTMDGPDLDVNVHPTKMELRFSNQNRVFQFVQDSVEEALRESELIPRVELDDVKMPESNLSETTALKKNNLEQAVPAVPKISTGKKIIERPPHKNTNRYGSSLTSEQEQENLEYFMEKMKQRVQEQYEKKEEPAVKSILETQKQEQQKTVPQQEKPVCEPVLQPTMVRETGKYRVAEAIIEDSKSSEVDEVTDTKQLNLFEEKFLSKKVIQEYKLIGQIFGTYWLVEYQEQLYIIDQHAAHERVLYERTMNNLKKKSYTSQYISPPIVLNLSMSEGTLLEEHISDFTSIGFEIEKFGGDSYAVRAVPDNLFSIAKKELLMEMIDGLSEGINGAKTPELILEKVASMSCKAAVKGNSSLSGVEMDALIGELLSLDNPYHCPHGRPTIIAMTKRELEKKFKRIV